MKAQDADLLQKRMLKRILIIMGAVICFCGLAASLSWWFVRAGQREDSEVFSLVRSVLNNNEPSPGDFRIKYFELLEDGLKLKVSGTIIDDSDAVWVPYVIACQTMIDLFSKTKLEIISNQWNDYLVVTYSREAFREYRNATEITARSVAREAKREDIVRFFAEAISYEWKDEYIWKKATESKQWITAEEVPRTKNKDSRRESKQLLVR